MGITARLEDYTVNEIRTLGKVADALARDLLERVVKQVHPIMRKRSWRVPLVSEFYPKQPNLLGLNINAGQHIQVRLRRHNNESSFLSYENVLGTMLHELCHIVHGPHDEKFYGLLDILQNECEELMLRGGNFSASATFLGEGKKLSTCEHNPSERDLRRLAASAAERRTVVSSIMMPSDGRRLGGSDGSKNIKPLSPQQAAAAAAERRRLDNIRCGHSQANPKSSDMNGVSQKNGTLRSSSAASSKIHEPIVLDSDDDDNESLKSTQQDSKKSRIHHVLDADDYENSDDDIDNMGSIWSCPFCTFFNATSASKCLMCENMRPERGQDASLSSSSSSVSSSASWQSLSSKPQPLYPSSFSSPGSSSSSASVITGDASNFVSSWNCPRCTFINTAETIECAMCNLRVVVVAGDHWMCPQCRKNNDSNRWMCGTCQFLRSTAPETIIAA